MPTPNLITVILSTTTSLKLGTHYPVFTGRVGHLCIQHGPWTWIVCTELKSHVTASNKFGTFLRVVSLKLLNPITTITLSSLAHHKWTHRTQAPVTYIQPFNLHISTTLSLFNLLAALALHLWSLSLVHRHHGRYTSNWSLLLMCFTLSLEPAVCFCPSNSSQSLYLWLALYLWLSHRLRLLIHHSHHPPLPDHSRLRTYFYRQHCTQRKPAGI